ncbi:hypothetical protein Salat_2989500 [Sesamum alatum]|uniref:Uncharacterized protein n=1 Tax=Sesamum alatum TaxID=300844 RepID=A0AAE1XJ01_9LAMI|nr:hypothetical protein Salat_2989500 [Sesamum alatum]
MIRYSQIEYLVAPTKGRFSYSPVNCWRQRQRKNGKAEYTASPVNHPTKVGSSFFLNGSARDQFIGPLKGARDELSRYLAFSSREEISDKGKEEVLYDMKGTLISQDEGRGMNESCKGREKAAIALARLFMARLAGNENKRSKKKLAKIPLTYIATSSTKGSSLRA